jgi:signal transduction histidine kinase/ActR/RegA family two-component response regulator
MQSFSSPDFRALFEAAPGLYLVLTPDLFIVAVSNAYLNATLTTREEILGRNIFDVFPDNPDDPTASGVSNLRASLTRVLQTCEPDTMAVQKYDVRRPALEGGGFEERYWSPVNSPVCGSNGELTHIIHRVEDVSEFVRLRQSGRAQEELAHQLQGRAERMEAEIYQRAQQVAEANRKLTIANDSLALMYRRIAGLMERADHQPTPAGDGAEQIAPEEMVTRVERLIVEHQELEEQLRQSLKMEAVGRLAGGVAHDFNNLLTVIVGYAALLRECQPDDEAVSNLEEIEKAAARAAALTHRLLAFSRKQVLQPRLIDLNWVVVGMRELLRRLIGESIFLDTVLGSGLGRIKADPNQVEQVIMNLAVNARDAMPIGGRLTIQTRRAELSAPLQSLQPGAYVLLTVADTGRGMDEKTAARIFEPFFTTKEIGRGTGLGLSMVYGIVEQSGGLIRVDSAPGEGATFSVYLPVSEAADDLENRAQTSRRDTQRQGTILVVEDEPPLRRLVASVLAAAGHYVLEAVNGYEAIALAEGHEQIDLLLTDVIMPGITGPDVVARLRSHRPKLAVLYMSGYDNELIDQKALERSASFLPKPFTPHSLLASVGVLIGARAEGEPAG